MGLPWVRLDANIGTHDKILDLLSRPNGAKAFVLFISAMGWCGGQGTDGVVKGSALTINHGSKTLANLLVDTELWQHVEGGNYLIKNWAIRQELAVTTEIKRAAREASGRKANCRRWHGPDCGCWASEEASA